MKGGSLQVTAARFTDGFVEPRRRKRLKMIAENLADTDFESSKHLIYGKELLDFAKNVAKEYAATQGDGHALLSFIENSKIEANGRVFPSKLL